MASRMGAGPWIAATVALGILVIVLLAVAALAFLAPQSVVAISVQPPSLPYDGHGPYRLAVVREGYDLDLLFLEPEYTLYLGRDEGEPVYGHYLPFDFYPGAEDERRHIRRSSVRWSPAGATFHSASGHRVFVPQELFTGGR